MKKTNKPKSRQRVAPVKPAPVLTTSKPSKLETIGKIASFVGNVAPGPIGAIAKGIGSFFNSPTWWSAYQSGGLTTNVPLRITSKQRITPTTGTTNGLADAELRPFLLEIISSQYGPLQSDSSTNARFVCQIIPDQFTAFILPQIRHVLNAIPLQSNENYIDVLNAAATLFAIKNNLKMFRELILRQMPHIPAFLATCPIASPQYFAQMEALIKRIEYALEARVRLPHTMIQYLNWRYGRVFTTNPSAKAAWVMYTVVPLGAAYLDWRNTVQALEAIITQRSQATADLFNAYQTHNQVDNLPEDTLIHYDSKEFVLRTNIDFGGAQTQGVPSWVANLFIMDSDLDNDTTFIASTVSANTSSAPGYAGSAYSLFPISEINAWMFVPGANTGATLDLWYNPSSDNLTGYIFLAALSNNVQTLNSNNLASSVATTATNPNGYLRDISAYFPYLPGSGLGNLDDPDFNSYVIPGANYTIPYRAQGIFVAIPFSGTQSGVVFSQDMFMGGTPNTFALTGYVSINNATPTTTIPNTWIKQCASWMITPILAKALDFYNIDITKAFFTPSGTGNPFRTSGVIYSTVDQTAISIDAGLVTSDVLYTTQRSAVANLFNPERKHHADENRENLNQANRLLTDLTITGK